MAENSDIAWTDNTFNGWMGCTRKSEGCAGCYANDICVHFKHTEAFGPACTRVRTKNWSKPLAWDRRAKREGKKVFVFAFSMADVFDDHASIQQQWRDEFWALVKATPNLIWLVLTKRPENFHLLPADWGGGYPNVWLGVTVENQRRADERVPLLRAVPAAKRFLSVEPMLGPVAGVDGIDWVICGGESGSRFRQLKTEWVVALRDECATKGAAFFFKQWAAHHPAKDVEYPPTLDGVVCQQIPDVQPAVEKAAASASRPADVAPPVTRPVRERRLLAHVPDAPAQIACQGDRQFEEDVPRRNHDLYEMLDGASGAMGEYAGKVSAAANLDNAHTTVAAVYAFAYHATVVDPDTFHRMNTNGAGKPKVRPPSVKLPVKGYQEFYQAVKFVALTMRKHAGKADEKPAIPEKTLQRYAKVCCWLALHKTQPEDSEKELRARTITARETGIEALFDKLAGRQERPARRSSHVISFEREQLLCLERILSSVSDTSDPAFPSLHQTVCDAVASLPILPDSDEARVGEDGPEESLADRIVALAERGDANVHSIREQFQEAGIAGEEIDHTILALLNSGVLFRADGRLETTKSALDRLYSGRYWFERWEIFQEFDWNIRRTNAFIEAASRQEFIYTDKYDNIVLKGCRARRKRWHSGNAPFWLEMLFDATPDCDCHDGCSCEKDGYEFEEGFDCEEDARKRVDAAKHRATNYRIYKKAGNKECDSYHELHGDEGERNPAYDQWLAENYKLIEEG